MAATRTGRPETRSTSKATLFNAAAIDHAVCLIHQVCCLAGFFDLVEEFRDQALSAAIERHDSAVLFDRLMFDFSFQGISDEIAINYMRRHGRVTWRSVCKNLNTRPTCPKLQSYWHFHHCRYEKTSRTCAEPDHIDTCPLPTHPLRNGHLNQIAYSLYLFIRDVGEGDLVGWIDDRLDQTNESGPDALAQACNGLIEPLRNVYGVADKVLAMALSGILIGAADVRPRWLEVGVHLIAVDTLVHNFLHRTGILAGSRLAIHTGPAVTVQAAAPTLSGWSLARSTLGSSTVPSRRSSPGSYNSRSGGIAAS